MVREEGLDTLGKTIRFYRKKAGMTQEQLAEKIYTKKSVISEIENDKHSVTVIRLIEIAAVLDIHPAKLLEYTYSVNSGRSDEVFHQVIDELNKLEDMELVGMVLDFVLMLQRSSFNKKAV